MLAPSIIPALRYRDALAAIEFLKNAFGFVKNEVFLDGTTVKHAQLTHDGGMVMLGSEREEPDQFDGLGPMSVYVIVTDVRAHHSRAVDAGAEIVLEPTEEHYGGWNYTAKDPEGNLWSFGDYRPEVAKSSS